ncbi:MAG TPA: alpha-amylase family glycosyl hydrolase, partial [Thermoanaerobaculia bacterium]|nr:alpha-amylase family glycosyl hydrolase [Thermoanaerobaculia bacterium]
MDLLPLDRLGVHETQPGVVTFGAVFPGIRPPARVIVRILHHAEQFLQDSLPYDYDLQHQPQGVPGLQYPDYWSVTLDMKSISPRKRGSRWGRDGRYVYRYWIVPEQGEPVDWVSDPFGREFGGGAMSAFTLGYRPYEWDDAETEWKTPYLRDLVIYELMLSEFAGNLQGAMRQLPYLADLGVNCIEIMPVSYAARTIDWGFLPTGYFGVDERFGTRTDMHRFIEAAHARKIAVILDSVYGHTDARFPYEYLYSRLHLSN